MGQRFDRFSGKVESEQAEWEPIPLYVELTIERTPPPKKNEIELDPETGSRVIVIDLA
jgi:hypothetical protein